MVKKRFWGGHFKVLRKTSYKGFSSCMDFRGSDFVSSGTIRTMAYYDSYIEPSRTKLLDSCGR